jgi:O-antigen ligase
MSRSPHARVRRSPPWSDRVVEGGALFLLIVTPLVYGTVTPWGEALAELVILGMAAAWVLSMVRQGALRVAPPPSVVPGALFLMLVLFQLVPLPRPVVELLSPLAANLHREVAAYAGAALGAVPLSLDPHETWREWLKLLGLAVFFLLLYNTVRTRGQVQRALWTMVVMGTLVSIFAIVQRATWTGRLYWIGPTAPDSAFGPFVNRTHFAGLMIVIVPMALAMILGDRRPSDRPPIVRGWLDQLRRWNAPETGPARLIAFLVLLMGGATLVSGSRGGAVSLLAGLLCMIGLGVRALRGQGRATRVAIATVLIILAAVWISWDILYGTIERLAEEIGHAEASARVHIWGDALGLWRLAPILGTGFATFGEAYPRMRTIEAPVAFGHAESDWVQLLTDTGVAGLGLALATAGSLVWALLRRYRRAPSPWVRNMALAGAVALIGTVVQGIGNYNLPILSNQLYLAMGLAMGLRAGDLHHGRSTRGTELDLADRRGALSDA